MSHEKQKNLLASSLVSNGTNMLLVESLKSIFPEDNSNKPTADFSLNSKRDFFSEDTIKIMDKIRELELGFSSIPTVQTKGSSLNERLFDARANVKILISQVSMHISAELRERLFRQIDLLHDPEEWEDGESPINLLSFKTFLRWVYLNSPEKLPSFGLSSSGNFIASWIVNKDRLILEFLSKDNIKWFVTKYYVEEADHGAGTTKISRISDVLAPYNINDWLSVKG